MRVLVACEASGVVRRAFAALGHSVTSVDLEPCEDGSPDHVVGDARPLLRERWDLVIAHPPCRFLSVSGSRFWGTQERQAQILWASAFFLDCWRANAPRVCVENPAGILSRQFRPDQYVHPWQFGDPWLKRTGLWLRNLQKLEPWVRERPAGVRSWVLTRGGGRDHRRNERLRSAFWPGIARAMAERWSYDPPSLPLPLA